MDEGSVESEVPPPHSSPMAKLGGMSSLLFTPVSSNGTEALPSCNGQNGPVSGPSPGPEQSRYSPRCEKSMHGSLDYPPTSVYHRLNGGDTMDYPREPKASNMSTNSVTSTEANCTNDISDAESFDGKIVYNPDGSAYIIEGGESDLSDSEGFEVPQQEGSIVESRGKIHCAQSVPSFPQIANAFYIQRHNSHFLKNMYSMYHEARPKAEAPIMHSYRVYDVRTKKLKDRDSDMGEEHGSKHSSDALTVPTKPILMCFICKLSFGYTKSFVAHSISEHNMTLNDEERDIMSHKNASAIIQGLGKDKEPLMSFLEPMSVPKPAGCVSTQDYPQSRSPPRSGLYTTASTSLTYTQKLAVSSTAEPPKSPAYGKGKEIDETKDVLCNGAGSQATAGHSRQGAMSEFVSDDVNQSFHDRENHSIHTSPRPSHGADLERNISGSGSDGNHCSKDSDMNLHTSSPNRSDRNSVDTVASSGSGAPLMNGPVDDAETDTSPLPLSASPGASSGGGAIPTVASPKLPVQQGLVITGCEDHPNGKQQGVECSKCDLMMESSRNLGNQLGLIHSRNSCKTLKCPKCNWHYKYQETLEIHMKEKHPDSDAQCIYCITNQPHPRLSRGEVYTCGYKPYRCEVCNYSTTTKGNLSIHMQSDKHINNMQELQKVQTQSTCTTPTSITSVSIPAPQPVTPEVNPVRKANKPKPTWRCDVCNYETNVARNLRIHMTSEKHTHNMMMLQQNMKTMQRDMQMHLTQMGIFNQDAGMYPMPPYGQPGFPPHFPLEQAAMFMPPPFAQNATPNMDNPMNLTKENEGGSVYGDQALDVKNNNNQPSKLFFCAVCNMYSCDTIEELHQHMQMDRSRSGDGENVVINSGNYMCKLCTYKTNLKANFQLHCKTDKHMQRLQLVNHIREGGPGNEWLVKYMNATNPVQIKCSACDYFTNSIGKLQVHTTDPRHEASAKLYHFLRQKEAKVEASTKAYVCTLCRFGAKTKLGLVQHMRSSRHIKQGRLEMMQLAEQGRDIQLAFDSIYDVREYDEDDGFSFQEDGDEDSAPTPESDAKASPGSADTRPHNATTPQPGSSAGDRIHMCPYCNYSSVSEMRIEAHVVTQHMQRPSDMLCPLCQDSFPEKHRLEKHLVQVHSVTAEGLQRLLCLVETPQKPPHPATPMSPIASQGPPPMVTVTPSRSPVTPTSAPSRSTSQLHTPPLAAEGDVSPGGAGGSTPGSSAGDDMVDERAEMLEKEAMKLVEEATKDGVYLSEKEGEEQYRCQMCTKVFQNIDDLYSHQNELGHLELKQTPRGPGYLCWKKGCNQYFKTAQTLQVHFREIHAKRQQVSVSERHVYKFRCNQCSLAFRTMEKLQLHSKYHSYRAATQCQICDRSFRSITALQKHVESWHLESMTDAELEQYRSSLQAANSLFEGSMLPRLKDIPDDQSMPTSRDINLSTSLPNLSSLDQKSPNSMTKDIYLDTPVRTKAEGEESPHSDNTQASLEENTSQEDYLNSLAVAEGSYDDPTRKYKCHRCKVAFTKQSYLSAHNKTVMHRKGDKLSYPMEKYLDPNRPYKCETCKESFTQKNILLVHYNSVSHLHKLKQVAQQHQQAPVLSPVTSPTHPPPLLSPSQTPKREKMTPSPQPTTPVKQVHSPVAASTPNPPSSTSGMKSPGAATRTASSPGVATSTASSPNQEEKKPFKCNICKVAYSQSTTLDIHMRSVLHQTRASKLHELVMTGQVDLSQPLIEQPDMGRPVSHKKALADMIHQKMSDGPPHHRQSVSPARTKANNASFACGQGPLDVKPDLSQLESAAKFSQAEAERIDIATKQAMLAFQQAEETMMQHHQQFQNLFQPPLLTQEQTPMKPVQQQVAQARFIQRGIKPHLHKSLLENFGFECVMQFNEYQQHRKARKEAKEEHTDENKETDKEYKEQTENEEENKENKEIKFNPEMPEVNKCKCSTCGKEFSSIWVLKAHQEEIHRDIVDIDLVQEFGEKFREVFEKKCASQQAEQTPETPTSMASGNDSGKTGPQNATEPSLPATPTTPFDMNSFNAQMMQMPMFGMMPFPMPMGMPLPMQPPFMPMMMMPPGMDSPMPPGMSPGMPMMDPALVAAQRAAQEQANNAKRVRTRINDEQLKILRAHFDINNSPSEDQILEMSEKSGLPPKVIKHWFRNTLFKERQRNKDSPYNFNNPPSTSINLEEYEKTGRVTTISSEGEKQNESMERKPSSHMLHPHNPGTPHNPHSPHNPHHREDDIRIKTERYDLDERSMTSMESPTSSVSSTPTPSTPRTPLPGGLMNPLISPTSLPTHHGHSMASKYASYHEQRPHHQPPQASVAMSKALPMMTPSQQSVHSMQQMQSKRANRTRFTDHQIKVLQEYFERNAYPKDDDLEHLSKMLGLSPRVIVVWFQNARQKARKSYENQPPLDLSEDGTRFNRTPGLNYQCKKCMTVFQRYFELIKHQQTQCYKDEDSRSPYHERRGSTSTISPMPSPESSFQGEESQQEKYGADTSMDAPSSSKPSSNPHPPPGNVMSTGMFPGFGPSSAFAMLQNVAQQSQQQVEERAQQHQQQQQHQSQDMTPFKRKAEDVEDSSDDQPRDKRLRTTILPEQLDYLYQQYQLDCNPSRKQLEDISAKVGLKKRVVQVWFQNTRARERKGQYRAHQQLIHKRCPFCRALFRAKSALESHLATKHPEEMAKGDINVDSIPDAAEFAPPASPGSQQPPGLDMAKLMANPYNLPNPFMGLVPPGLPPGNDPLQMNMSQLYQDSFKKYIDKLSGASHQPKTAVSSATTVPSAHTSGQSKPQTKSDDADAPLDLSKPVRVKPDPERPADMPLRQDVDPRSFLDDSISETMSESTDYNDNNDSGSIQSDSAPPSPNIPGRHLIPAKRYRTQMSSLQIKVMKMIFAEYKTPTMAECEMLGQEIGLAKRVIQVWFQNARAKEKKSKMSFPKSFGEVELPRQTDECRICNFKYSHKYTIQDHLFTKKHLENLKRVTAQETDGFSGVGTSSAPPSVQGVEQAMQSLASKASMSTHPQLAQLQAMGLQAMSMPGPMANLTANTSEDNKKHSSGSDGAVKAESKEESGSKNKESREGGNQPIPASMMHDPQIRAQMAALSGMYPGADMAALSQMMYGPGMGAMYPGVGGFPMMQHGFMPGPEMYMYDPTIFGTPLALLQIPQEAIVRVQAKVQDPTCTLTTYTQDCKGLQDLRDIVREQDFRLVREARLDVGYICKKCSMVYPGKDACVGHLQSVCFQGKTATELKNAVLKLEQVQYECRACREKFSTVSEFRNHCKSETHRERTVKMATSTVTSSTSTSTSSGTSISSSGEPSSGKSSATQDDKAATEK